MADLIFRAPWDKTLKTITALTAAMLAFIAFVGITTGPKHVLWYLLMVGLPIIILLGASLFVVRGYKITDRALEIQRLVWSDCIPLTEIESALTMPNAMRNSLRTFGNGGFFVFAGHFRNAELGRYEAYVTDLNRTVVLTLPHRKILLSPENPENFVAHLQACSQNM